MRYVSSISLALAALMALAMGCVSPAPPLPATTGPTTPPTKLPYLAFQLNLKIDPKEAATFLLNPNPLGKGGYPQGMIVTIDILPDEGWEVDEWVGPVFNIDGTTAQIEMASSQSVAVRLKLTTPPTATPNPKPSATRSGFTYAPPREGADRGGGRDARVIQPTATRGPKPLVRPTARPIPTPTQVPWTKVPTWVSRTFLAPAPTPTATPNASYYFNKGADYYYAMNWVMAIGELTNAIQVNPKYPNAYWYRGVSYRQLGQNQNAIADYTKAIQLDPGKAILYSARSASYQLLGQYQLAINDATTAIQLDPDYADAYLNRGIAYHNQTPIQNQLAVDDYTKAIQLDPGNANAFNNRAIAYQNLGQTANANADKTMACSLDSQWC